MTPNPVTARLFQGVRDVLPEELFGRQRLLRTLEDVFQRFGFGPLETPAMEYLDILLGKYGVEGEKLIYKLAYRDGKTLALRYDLTVPLSRVVAMHPELPRPFKRYQVQPVWRADTAQPAQGRFREFIQCDVDTVGTPSVIADAENVAVVHEGILALGLSKFVVRINNRKVLKGIRAWAGIDERREADLFRSIDKLDKIGLEGVRQELADQGFDSGAVDRTLDLMSGGGSVEEVLGRLDQALAHSTIGLEGVRELRELLECVVALGVATDRLTVDPTLTRGLDYYTGPIYEVNLTELEKFGSLGGGGRYDDLMSLYGIGDIPATGVSIGLSRVHTALDRLGLLERRQSSSQVLVMRFPDTPLDEALGMCRDLRHAGIACELYYETDRLKKQFQLAERKGIPLVAMAGGDEIRAGTVNLKHLGRGEQVAVARSELAVSVQKLLQ